MNSAKTEHVFYIPIMNNFLVYKVDPADLSPDVSVGDQCKLNFYLPDSAVRGKRQIRAADLVLLDGVYLGEL